MARPAAPGGGGLAPVAGLVVSKKAPVAVAFLTALAILVGSLWLWLAPPPPDGFVGTALERPAEPIGPRFAAVPAGENVAAGTVAGRVLDPEGRPAAGTRVVLMGEGRGPDGRGLPTLRAVSDAAGAFHIAEVTPGRYHATATDDRWAGGFSSGFSLPPGGHHSMTLRLGVGHPIEGQILDEGGGPIPGARVSAGLSYPWSNPGTHRQFLTIADQEGRYRLVLSPHEYRLWASARGYATADITAAVTRPLRRDILLSPAARVSGTVVDGSGLPVPGARVRLSVGLDSDGSAENGRTDAQGKFRFDDVEAGSYQPHASRGTAVGFGRPLSVVPLEPVEGLVIELKAGLTVTGRITDQKGAGLGGVDVRMSSRVTTDPDLRASGRTAADGSYRLEGLLPGSYQLAVDGAEAGFMGHKRIVQLAGSRPHNEDVQLAAAASLTGQVLGIDGQPARALLVRLEPAADGTRGPGVKPSMTDEEGRFRLLLADSGRMVLTAWARNKGVASVPLDVAPGSRDRHLELRLAPGASIGGQVRFEDGAPAAGVSVAMTRQEGTAIHDSTTTGEDGAFQIDSLAPGRYVVHARRKAGPWNLWTSGEEPHLKLIDVEANQKKTGVVLVLPRGGHRISGLVLLADGSPAAGARVVARVDDGDTWKPSGHTVEHRATVGDDGRFALQDLEKARFILWATRHGLPDVRQNGVAAGREDVRLQLSAGASISGAVRTGAGKPVTDYTITIVPAPGPGLTREQQLERRVGLRAPQRVQASDGRFSVEALEAGSYELRITSAEGENGSQVVTVRAGEQKTGLQLVTEAGTTVRGRVLTWKGGEPVEGAEVEAEIAARRVATETDSNGNFTLRGIPAGETFTLEVQSGDPNLVPEETEVVVPARARELDGVTVRLVAGPDWQQRRETAGRVGLRPVHREGRLVVRDVSPSGPAARAGLVPGDVFLAVNGQSLEGLGLGAASYYFARPPGTKLSIQVLTAAGQQKVVALVPEK